MRSKVQLSFSFFISLFLIAATCLAVVPSAHAAEDLEVSGWIPYWAVTEGTRDARRHLDELSVIHPFGYSVKLDGSLNDLMDISDSSWKRLFRSARSKDVLIIPTIMWSDGSAIHRVLSNKELREDHIDAIVREVKKRKYDGIDIDYEGKLSETKAYFSLFLEELKDELGNNRRLTCTIEARTPPESLYPIVPATIEYANDYEEIGEHCDRVQIMAYDQQRADIRLNELRAGEPYMPVSDVDWVRKVAQLAAASIPKEKLVLGIPTYGNHYEISVSPNWYRGYRRIGAINPPLALEIAKEQDITPSRNRAGEMSFSYISPFSAPLLSMGLLSIAPTSSGNKVAATALAFANITGMSTVFNYVSWSDAEAVEAKVKLAEELGLKGVSLFKIDGEEDPDIWDLF